MLTVSVSVSPSLSLLLCLSPSSVFHLPPSTFLPLSISPSSPPSVPIFLAGLMKLGYVSSIATKLSDTFASEIGKAYGKNCYLITTLKSVPRGTEGAVSVEGTLAGVVGSLIIAVYGALTGLISWPGVAIAAVAAFVACNCESLIGATGASLPYVTLSHNTPLYFT